MTDARITQGVRVGLGAGDSDARATQAVRLTIGKIGVPARTTQGVRLTLAQIHVDARATQAVRLVIGDAVPCTTQWQQLWIITRRDGVTFRYTSLDRDFTWGEDVYKACGSMLPSAAEEASAVGQVSNMELTGIITDDGITEPELYGGLFDDAFIQVWLVPYVGTEAPRRLAAGWAGNLSHGEKGFNMEVVGPGARLDQQALVQLYGPGCRWVFGSPQCGFDREAVKLQGAVLSSLNRGIFVGDLTDPGGLQWENGLVRWTSGPNDGRECEVKDVVFNSAGAEVELWELAPFRPEYGDTFDLLPGCDLSAPTCKMYGRYLNFGGFPDVPGEDALVETPDAKFS